MKYGSQEFIPELLFLRDKSLQGYMLNNPQLLNHYY